MYFPLFNPMYYLFALPALILGLYAQYRVRASYQKYQQVRSRSGLEGAQAARRLLDAAGLQDVGVNETPGQLSDHYDPRSNNLYLSSGVARSGSVAALGIVAHEVGHAVQDQQDYFPMKVRGGLVPVVQIGSWLGPILFLVGMFLPALGQLSLIGLLLFSGTFVFALITLPVEYNASHRAIAMLRTTGLVSGGQEEEGARKVLSAAALTYVAAAAQALSTILYYVFLLSGSRRRR